VAEQFTVKSQTGPTITSGGLFYQGFGEFEKVTAAMLSSDVGTGISGYAVVATPTIVSGNVVRVQLSKTSTALSGVSIGVSGYAAGTSGDCLLNTFTILATGE
jgi:hypothetical protein